MASRVAFLGDTHANTRSLRNAAKAASSAGCGLVFHVGDLWWQPGTAGHSGLVATLSEVWRLFGVTFVLTDGNNDDTADLLSHATSSDRSSPFYVCDGLLYAPRGSSMVISGCKFVFFGGALSYKNPKYPISEEHSSEEALLASSHADVDVLVTHDSPAESEHALGLNPSFGSESRRLVSEVLYATSPRLLFHGHYHKSVSVSVKETTVYGLARDKGDLFDLRVLDLESFSVSSHTLH
jgi:predicted phosphodiesterase